MAKLALLSSLAVPMTVGVAALMLLAAICWAMIPSRCGVAGFSTVLVRMSP
jgi:hypothetical protein